MSLSREQYDGLMLEYARRRDLHKKELDARRQYVYAHVPGYRALEQKVPAIALHTLEKRLFGTGTAQEKADADTDMQRASAAISSIAQQKRKLLHEAGLPADYLEMHYDCPICRDTGYVDGHKCSCLRRAETSILYDQSNLKKLLEDNNFAAATEEYYRTPEDIEHYRGALAACRKFINNFDSDYENLYLYGTVGTGKSFLAISTAGELLASGHSVLYFSASGLFERISACYFDAGMREERADLMNDLYHCDLLIIDDLGTEMTNSFVLARLFALISERSIGRVSTIITTNLSLKDLQERYSERIFSRITSGYTLCKLTGPDIRLKKKVRIINGADQKTR